MKKIHSYLTIFFSLTLTLTALSHIIESATMAIIPHYIDDQYTLVVFDVDNTLARPKTYLGSDEWFYYLVNEKIKSGYDYLSAIYSILPICYYVQFSLWLQLTESIIPTLIEELTKHNIHTMALTARSPYIAERTHEQLNHLNIIFWPPYSADTDFILPMPHPCLYRYGTLFSGDNDKGEALIYLLDSIDYHPTKIIFIDDKLKNIRSVEKAASDKNISFVGIHYTYCDELVHNFDPEQAHKELLLLKEQNAAMATRLKRSPLYTACAA
jgi:Protein of unknown function (DUF2608)